MKAVYYDKPGPPEVLKVGELPTPQPKAGEVLVRVKASAINPIDTYIRSGMVTMPQPKPTIPGCDLAGVIEKLGVDAGRFKVGDRVWGSNQGLLGRQGTMAEYACVEDEWLYPTPADVTNVDAAAAALTAITAHLGLFRCARLQPGETLFVNGGTGGVGSMVVQMAKAAGAQVIATVGSLEKAGLCLQLGADLAINYKTDDIAEQIEIFTSTNLGRDPGVDVWYETQAEPDFQRTVESLASRGRMVIIAGRKAQPVFPLGPFRSKDLSLFGFSMFKATADEQRECAKDINRWLSEKKLRVLVGKTFPLAEAAAAHRLQEENTLNKAGTLSGKIVVTI
ncbi:MAG TPA: NADPH:quinone reductase [Gemmataceae bacterium]|jgi:NADPH2:quinone reductase|nr:NADPH:quinone reductase [Gemmataceae bacterium]